MNDIITILLLLFLLGLLSVYLWILVTTIKKEEKSTEIKKESYRLGDFIMHKTYRDQLMSSYLKHYPYSIAIEYLSKTKESSNLPILLEVIKRRKKECPEENTLIIHLRIGDVIDHTHYTINDFLYNNIGLPLENGSKGYYVKPLQYYKTAFASFENIDNIVLVGGFHMNYENRSKSHKYVQEIAYFFEQYNVTVEKRINGDPDEDFVYMCHAKNFIPSGGGYSLLIAKLVQMQNGKVYQK
jgi:hypothetical protein